jgi:hypothetical protein
LRVDSLNGNDGTGIKNGLPFLTITAALTAAVAGDTVFISPGTYAESITIPTSVSVVGFSSANVLIQKLLVTANTDMVTMGISSRLENVTVNVTSATVSLTVKAIVFPSTTATNASVINCIISASNTNTGAGTIYGVHSSGTGVAPIQFTNIKGCDISVSGAVTTNGRAVLVNTSANTLRIRECTIVCNGTTANGTYIAAESNIASSELNISNSSLSGTGGATRGDISQTIGTISLTNCSLINNTSSSLPFTIISPHSIISFGVSGAVGSITSGVPVFAVPGISTTSTNEVQMASPINMIIKNMYAKSRVNIATQALIITLRRAVTNVAGTATAITATMAIGTSTASDTTHTISVAAGDLLSVALTVASTNSTSAADIVITFECI